MLKPTNSPPDVQRGISIASFWQVATQTMPHFLKFTDPHGMGKFHGPGQPCIGLPRTSLFGVAEIGWGLSLVGLSVPRFVCPWKTGLRSTGKHIYTLATVAG